MVVSWVIQSNFKCWFQIAQTLPGSTTLTGGFWGPTPGLWGRHGMATFWTSEFEILLHGARPAYHTRPVFSATWRASLNTMHKDIFCGKWGQCIVFTPTGLVCKSLRISNTFEWQRDKNAKHLRTCLWLKNQVSLAFQL